MHLERYTTPAIIAGAAHVALFLAAPEVPARLSDSGSTNTRIHEIPLPKFEPPPPSEPDEAKSEVAPVKPLKGDNVPKIPDIMWDNEPREFVVPLIEGTTNPTKNVVKIDGPPGDPNGEQNGELRFVGPPVAASWTLDSAPQYRARPAPEYPFSARQTGQEGEVVVEFDVDATGRVAAARVLRSSDRIFEEPAVRAVRKWRFEPGRRDGRVVAFRMTVPVVFRLSDDRD